MESQGKQKEKFHKKIKDFGNENFKMLLERFSFTKFGRKKFLNNQVLTRTDHSPEKRNLININVIFQHINSAKRTEIFDFF